MDVLRRPPVVQDEGGHPEDLHEVTCQFPVACGGPPRGTVAPHRGAPPTGRRGGDTSADVAGGCWVPVTRPRAEAVSVHTFVDESKLRGLLVVAAVLAPRDLAQARTAMRELCLPGQARLHFTKERPG